LKETRAAVLILILLVSFGSLFQNVFTHNSFPLFPSPVKAQSQVTVTTDKPVYNVGDTITIYIQPALPNIGGSFWLIIIAPDLSQARIDLSGGQATATTQAGPQNGQYTVQLWGMPMVPNATASILASTTYIVQPTTTTSAVTVYSLPIDYLNNIPANPAAFDLHASIQANYVLNGQSNGETKNTPFTFQVDSFTQATFSVASAPAGWEFACVWNSVSGNQNSCTLTLMISGGQWTIVAFFKQKTNLPDLIAQSCAIIPASGSWSNNQSPQVGDGGRFVVDFSIVGGAPPYTFNYQVFLDGNLMQTLPANPVSFNAAGLQSITTDTVWKATAGTHTERGS
jgi:hypothetical protein